MNQNQVTLAIGYPEVSHTFRVSHHPFFVQVPHIQRECEPKEVPLLRFPHLHPLSLGVYYAKGTPVPIPNTAVKLRRAYGTAVLTVEESVNAKIERMISGYALEHIKSNKKPLLTRGGFFTDKTIFVL